MSALHAAMAKAFPAIEGATKDASNTFFQGAKYATLSAVVEAIKPALIANGLFFVQMTHEQEGGVCIETVVYHTKGEALSFGKLFVPASKQDAQGYGSALTYARRYSLMTAFGVCPEDDDGNAAVSAPAGAQDRRRPAAQKLDGPYTSPTALKNAVHGFARELEACDDEDSLTAFLATDDSKALSAQLRRDAPWYLDGGDQLPPEFIPLRQQIANRRALFAQQG